MRPPRPGAVIGGKYKLDRVLRQGRMCLVGVARHKHLSTPVALKILHGETAENPAAVARFLREGELASLLRSDHVVRILDVGVTNAIPYIAMELLEGADVAHHIVSKGALDPATAAAWLLDACEAIAEAHAMAIIHRDIKPSNLFVTRAPDGSPFVKVLDFGIASASTLPDDLRMTATEEVLGTPLYMAPEVMESARNASVASDLWALGATLFEMLTGRVPFEGLNMVEVYSTITRQPLTRPRQLRDTIPEAVEAVVLRCLEREPAKRYASVREFVAALAAAALPAEEAASRTRRVERVCAEAATRAAQALEVADSFSGAADTYGPLERGIARLSWKTREGVLIAAIALASVAIVSTAGFLLLRRPAPGPAPPALGAAPKVAVSTTSLPSAPVPSETPSASSSETAMSSPTPQASTSSKPRTKLPAQPGPKKHRESDFATDPHR